MTTTTTATVVSDSVYMRAGHGWTEHTVNLATGKTCCGRTFNDDVRRTEPDTRHSCWYVFGCEACRRIERARTDREIKQRKADGTNLDHQPMRLTLTWNALSVMGLDDAARYPDVRRESAGANRVVLHGTRAALTDLVTELEDRAVEGAEGYNEAPKDKAVCRRAVASAMSQGVYPRSAGVR
jgi:hypothetical protein